MCSWHLTKTCHTYLFLNINSSYSQCFLVIFRFHREQAEGPWCTKKQVKHFPVIVACQICQGCQWVQIKRRKRLKLPVPEPPQISSQSPHFSKLLLQLRDAEMEGPVTAGGNQTACLWTTRRQFSYKQGLPSSFYYWYYHLNSGKWVGNNF